MLVLAPADVCREDKRGLGLYPCLEEQGTEFCFRKLEFNMRDNAYSNKTPFKYFISILGGRGSEAMLILHIFLGAEFGKTYL